MYYAPTLKKNLVFRLTLNCLGYKLIFELGKFIRSRDGTF